MQEAPGWAEPSLSSPIFRRPDADRCGARGDLDRTLLSSGREAADNRSGPQGTRDREVFGTRGASLAPCWARWARGAPFGPWGPRPAKPRPQLGGPGPLLTAAQPAAVAGLAEGAAGAAHCGRAATCPVPEPGSCLPRPKPQKFPCLCRPAPAAQGAGARRGAEWGGTWRRVRGPRWGASGGTGKALRRPEAGTRGGAGRASAERDLRIETKYRAGETAAEASGY